MLYWYKQPNIIPRINTCHISPPIPRYPDPRSKSSLKVYWHSGKHILYHRIDSKVSSLYLQAKENKWTDESTIIYEKLDKLLTEGMLHAEKEVSRKLSKTYWWSPTLSNAVKTFHFWQLRLRFAQGYTFNTEKIGRLQRKLNLDHKLSQLPIEGIVKYLRASQKIERVPTEVYWLAWRTSKKFVSLLEARVIARNPSLLPPGNHKQLEKRAAKEVHCIQSKEAQRTIHSRIHPALHPAQRLGGAEVNGYPIQCRS